MALDDLKKDQLIEVGEWFGVEGVAEAKNNADRLALILDDGVDDALYEEERANRRLDKNHEPILDDEEEGNPASAPDTRNAPTVEPEQVDEKDLILIKMERKNHSFEHMGAQLYRFTKQHPYQLVHPDDEQALIDMGGFRTATQNELKEFYK